jgi:hypothetical protein
LSTFELDTTRAVVKQVWSPARLDVALFGTPLLLLVNVRDDRGLTVVVAAMALVVFLNRRVREAPAFWLLLAAVIAARQLGYFLTLDDHVVASTYWCLGLGCGLLAVDREGTQRRTAGLLVGLVFALAATWKLTSGQFVDARFFRFTMIWDGRFEHLEWITDQQRHEMHRDALRGLLGGPPGRPAVTWTEGPRSDVVATAMTWWGLVIEVAVAVTFLLPLRRMAWVRHAALLAFMATTYLVVPITGFGLLLSVLGAVHTDDVRWRRAYLVAFVALVVIWPPIWRLLTGYDP